MSTIECTDNKEGLVYLHSNPIVNVEIDYRTYRKSFIFRSCKINFRWTSFA